jgi:hypothetical protein
LERWYCVHTSALATNVNIEVFTEMINGFILVLIYVFCLFDARVREFNVVDTPTAAPVVSG